MCVTKCYKKLLQKQDVMKRKQYFLPERQIDMIKKLAKKRGVSEAECLRYIIDTYSDFLPVIEKVKKELYRSDDDKIGDLARIVSDVGRKKGKFK